jgi:hypothetical protein
MEFVFNALQGGLASLAAYLAAHVLLCLLPAFFIAGAMSALMPQGDDHPLPRPATPARRCPTRPQPPRVRCWRCARAPSFRSSPASTRRARASGRRSPSCSSHRRPTSWRWSYTGGAHRADLAIARFVLSLTFGIGIGLIMALLFRRRAPARPRHRQRLRRAGRGMGRMALVFLFVWVALLLAGTLKLDVLTGTYLVWRAEWVRRAGLAGALDRLVPYDAAKGEEGVSVQGVVLIALLASIGGSAWRGFENIGPWLPTRGPGSAWR